MSERAIGGYHSSMPFPRSLSGMTQDRSLLLFLCGLAAAMALFLTVSNTGQAFAELSPTHLQDTAANAAADQASTLTPRVFSRNVGDSVAVASTFDGPGARVPRVFNVGISDGLNIATSPTPPPPSNAATANTTSRPSAGLQQGTGRAEEKLGPRNPAESKGDLTNNKDQKNGSVQEQPQGSISQELESVLSTLMQDLFGSDDSEPDDSSRSNSHHAVAVQVPPTIYIDSLYGAYAIAVIAISVGKSPRVVSIKRRIVAFCGVEPQEDKPHDAEMSVYVRTAMIVVVIVAAIAMASAAGPVMGEAFADTNAAGTAYRSNTGTNTVNSPKYREWNPGTSAWSSEVELPTAGSPIRTIKYLYSPTSAERAVATLSDNGDINLFVCDNSCTTASKWTRVDGDTGTAGIQPIANMGTPTAPYSYFDIAYEQSSGKLMIVYDKTITTDTNDFWYRTYSNGVLSSESGFDYASDGTSDNDIRYFKMASKPGSNEITLIVEDATLQDAIAMIWSGSSWGNIKTISSAMGTTSITGEAIGVAYETSSGASVVFAGNGADSAAYARWTGSWSSVSTTDPNSGSGNDVKFVSMKSDPASGSNKIMICQLDDLTNLTCRQTDAGSLSGSSWTISGTITVSANTSRRFDFAWAPTGSTGLLIWDDTSNNRISRNTFTSPSTWGSTGTTALASTTTQVWIDSATNPTAADTVDSLWLTLNSNTLGIGSLKYDGSTLTSISTTSHTSAAGSTSYDAIAVDFQKSKVVKRSIAETITVSPAITKKVKHTLYDALTTSPSIVGARLKTVSASQTITITPTTSMKVTRSLPNTLTVSDSIAKSVTITPDSNVAAMAYRSDDGVNGSSSPKYREWNPMTKTWGSQVELESAGSPIRNAWIEFSPVSTKRVIIVLSDDGTLDSYACDFACTTPSNWVVSHDIVDLWNAVTPASQKRPFDIEFEHTSGDLMLVYDKEDGGDTSTDLFYRIMPDSSYTFGSENVIDDTVVQANDNVYSFVRLDSRRTLGSNDLGLVAESETNHHSVAWYWDGSTHTWGNQVALTTSVSADVDYEGVGIAFETSTGNLIAVASDGSNVVYSKFSGGSWSAPTSVGTLNVNTVRWVRLVPNPNAGTNGIMLVAGGYTGTQNPLTTAYWSGTSWTVYSGTRHDADIDSSTVRAFDFAWDNSGDSFRGILVWATNPNVITYKRYTVPDTWTSTLVDPPFSDDGATHSWISLNEHTNPTSADLVSVLGAAIDSSARLSQMRWDGKLPSQNPTDPYAWTDNGATTAGNTASESFHVDFRRSPVLKKAPLLTITVADALAAKIRTKVFSESVAIAVSVTTEKGSPLDSARSAAVYRSNTGTALLNSPKYREWDPATQTWSAEVELANTGSPIRDAIIRFSPDSSLRVIVSHSADGTLNLFKCDNSCTSASSWTLVAADFADTGTPDVSKPYRPYDILFETTGERLMIVYDKELTENADFYYRTFNGTALSAEAGVNLSGGSADAEELRYLHLAAHPTTNEMTLAVLDATNLKTYGAVWNGSTWGKVQTVSSSLSLENIDGDSVDVAYETQSGASLVLSGNGQNSAAYARWTGSSWTTGTTNPNPGVTTEHVKFLSLKSDPLSSSNKVMACQSDDGSALSCSQFNAGTPGTWTVVTGNTGTTAGRAFDFVYNPAGTTGLLVSSSGASGTLDYRAFNGTGFGTAATLSAAGTHKWILGASAVSTTDVVNSMFLKSNSNFDTGAIKSKAGKTSLIGDASLTSDSLNDTYESMHIDFQKSKNVKRASSDTVTVTPAVTRGVGKHLSDAVAVAPAVSKAVRKPLGDTINISAAVAKNPTRILPVTISVSDSVRKRVTRSLPNTLTIQASITAVPIFNPSVTLSIADSVAAHKGVTRSVSDTATIGVSASRTYHASRAASDALSVSPAVTTTLHATRSVSVPLSVGDVITKSIIKSLSDTLTVLPSVSRTYSPSRSLSDAVTVSPAVARTYQAFRSATEAFSVADAVTVRESAARSITDSVSLSDTVARQSAAARSAADAMAVSDAITSRKLLASRSLADALSATDSVNTSVSRSVSDTVSIAAAINTSATRSLSETLSATDAISPTAGRPLADTVIMTDAISRSVSRSLSDSVAVTDSVTRRASRSLADAVAVTDSVSTRTSRSAAETVSITDAIAANARRPLADELSVSDAISTSATRALADAVAVADAINTRMSRSLSDSVEVAETLSGAAARPLTAALTVTDAISIRSARSVSDSVTVMAEILQEGKRSVDSNLSISDSISTKVSRTLSDSLSVAASVRPNRNHLVSDSISLADTVSQKISRSLSDTLSMADALSTRVTRSLSETLGLTDSVAKLVSRSTSDSIAVTDAISTRISRSIADTLTLADSISRSVSRSLSDSLSATDAISRAASYYTSDDVSFADAIATRTSRSLADSLSVTDAAGRTAAASRSVSDATTVSSAITPRASYPLAESVTLTDTISVAASRSPADSVAVTDLVTTRASHPVSDTLAVTDAVRTSTSRSLSDSVLVAATVSTSISRSLADTLSVADAIAKSVSHSLSDSIIVTDAIAKSASHSVTETVGVSDAITRTVSRSPSDSLALADAITTAASRSLADTLSVADTIVPNNGRSISDTLTLADSITRSASRSESETLSVTDTISTAVSRSLTDSVTVMDAMAKSISRTIADTLTVAVNANSGPSRSVADSIPMTDAVSTHVSRSVSDSVTVISEILQEGKRSTDITLTLSDAITIAVSRSLADTVSLASNVSTAVTRSLSDSVAVTDSISHAVTRSLADSISVTDALSTAVSRSLSDSLSITTALNSMMSRTLSDSLSMDDIVVTAASRSLSDSIGLTDAITTSASRSLADAVFATDAIARAAADSRTASDSVTVTDAIITATSRSLSDSAAITDAIAGKTSRSTSDALSITDSISTSVSRSLSDTLTTTDVIITVASRPVSDSLSVTDAVAARAVRPMAETVSVTDAIGSHTSHSLSDSIAMVDTITKSVSHSLSEAITLADVISTSASRSTTDTVPMTDSISTSASRSVQDALSVTDAALPTGARSLAETVVMVDSISRATSRSISDTLSVAGAIVPTTSSGLAETLAITDEITTAVTRSIADMLTVAQSANSGAMPAVFDSVAMTDSLSTRVSRNISDSVTVISEILQEGVRTADSNITVTDAIATTVSRSISDSLSVTAADEIAGNTSRSTSDTLSLADGISTSTSRSLADTVSMTDSVNSATSRTMQETLSVTDTTATNAPRSPSDSMTVKEAISTSTSRSLSDAVGVTASVSPSTSALASVSDSLTLDDSVSTAVTRSPADSLTVSAGASMSTTSALDDTLAVADSISTNNINRVAVSDSVAVTDSVTGTLAASRLVADALALEDATGAPKSFARETSDSLTVADGVSAGGSINVPVSDSLAVSDAIARAGSGPFSDSVAVADSVSVGVGRSLADTVLIVDSAVPPTTRVTNDTVAIADQVSAKAGTAVSLADSLGVNSQITNVSVHWNRVFEEGVDLADCTPFSCNQSLHFDEGLSLADLDFFTSPPGRILNASLAVTDSIAVNRPQTFITLGDSAGVSITIKPLLPILVNNRPDDYGRPPNFSISGNRTWDGTPASLRDDLKLEPLYFNTTVHRDDLPNQVVTLRLWHVNITPTAGLPANSTLISDRAANIPAGVPVQARINFKDTPSLSAHSNFIHSLDVQFTPAMLTTDFGLIVTPMDAPPAGANAPPEELRPLYIDVRWWGNVPGGSDPGVQSYYQHPPTFTFTVTDDWARLESADRDANGVPVIKIRLLNETTHQWEEISAIQRPTSVVDGVYTFTATLPHFSDYVITAVKSPTAGPGTGSSSHPTPVVPKTFAANLADSLTLATSSSSRAFSNIEEFVGEKFSANLLDSVAISSKPVAYNTFKILKGVEVSITVVDVRQESVAPPSATAVVQTDIANTGDEAEKFTLNYWYNDQTGKRAFDLSQQVEVEAHGKKMLQVTIPFTEPGTYHVTAEARSVPGNDLLDSTQLTVVVPWLTVYLYVLIAVAIAIFGGSAIAIALYLARNGTMIATGTAAGAIILLGRKGKPRVRVAEKGTVDDDGDDDDYDLLVNVKLANSAEEGRLAPGQHTALFDFEIINKSRSKQEFVLAYHLVDMAGAALPESVQEVKIAKRKTQMRNARLELLAGAYVLHVEARTAKGEVLSSDRVSVRTA